MFSILQYPNILPSGAVPWLPIRAALGRGMSLWAAMLLWAELVHGLSISLTYERNVTYT